MIVAVVVKGEVNTVLGKEDCGAACATWLTIGTVFLKGVA